MVCASVSDSLPWNTAGISLRRCCWQWWILRLWWCWWHGTSTVLADVIVLQKTSVILWQLLTQSLLGVLLALSNIWLPITADIFPLILIINIRPMLLHGLHLFCYYRYVTLWKPAVRNSHVNLRNNCTRTVCDFHNSVNWCNRQYCCLSIYLFSYLCMVDLRPQSVLGVTLTLCFAGFTSA